MPRKPIEKEVPMAFKELTWGKLQEIYSSNGSLGISKLFNQINGEIKNKLNNKKTAILESGRFPDSIWNILSKKIIIAYKDFLLGSLHPKRQREQIVQRRKSLEKNLKGVIAFESVFKKTKSEILNESGAPNIHMRDMGMQGGKGIARIQFLRWPLENATIHRMEMLLEKYIIEMKQRLDNLKIPRGRPGEQARNIFVADLFKIWEAGQRECTMLNLREEHPEMEEEDIDSLYYRNRPRVPQRGNGRFIRLVFDAFSLSAPDMEALNKARQLRKTVLFLQ